MSKKNQNQTPSGLKQKEQAPEKKLIRSGEVVIRLIHFSDGSVELKTDTKGMNGVEVIGALEMAMKIQLKKNIL